MRRTACVTQRKSELYLSARDFKTREPSILRWWKRSAGRQVRHDEFPNPKTYWWSGCFVLALAAGVVVVSGAHILSSVNDGTFLLELTER